MSNSFKIEGKGSESAANGQSSGNNDEVKDDKNVLTTVSNVEDVLDQNSGVSRGVDEHTKNSAPKGDDDEEDYSNFDDEEENNEPKDSSEPYEIDSDMKDENDDQEPQTAVNMKVSQGIMTGVKSST